MFDSLLILSNIIKKQSNTIKQGGQTLKCLVTQHFSFGQGFIQLQDGLATKWNYCDEIIVSSKYYTLFFSFQQKDFRK